MREKELEEDREFLCDQVELLIKVVHEGSHRGRTQTGNCWEFCGMFRLVHNQKKQWKWGKQTRMMKSGSLGIIIWLNFCDC